MEFDCIGSWSMPLFLFVANLLVCHLLFVENVQASSIAFHLKDLDHSVEFCCQGPALTCVKEGG